MGKSSRRKPKPRPVRLVRTQPPDSRLPATIPSGQLTPAEAAFRVRPTYDVGKLKGSDRAIATLLATDRMAPDALVEMLLPLLWLYHAEGLPGNVCTSGSTVLQRAYTQLGIPAQIRAVDLVVSNRRTGKRTLYGRPDPYWDGDVFHGHCLVWLPTSGRIVDATVEQYPDVRRYRLGPIIGKAVMSAGGTAEDHAAAARGELVPGTSIGVQREELLLLYTVTDARFTDIVENSPTVTGHAAEFHRAGVNLAAHALTLLRLPEVSDRARAAGYPRLTALLDTIGTADMVADPDTGDFTIAMPGPDGTELSLRLDQLDLPENLPAPQPNRSPAPRMDQQHDPTAIMEDVDTEAALHTSTPAHLGGGDRPVVLFEPRLAVAAADRRSGHTSEMQAEAIIAAGFDRLLPGISADQVVSRPEWTVRRTSSGLELWDEGGIWARANVAPDFAWERAAQEHGQVLVLYGVQCGVRAPAAGSYSEEDRRAELEQARRNGIIAAARVSWRP